MAETEITPTTVEFEALSAVLQDINRACESLPQEAQELYRDAQRSIVEARRSAETNEGLLQVC